MCEVKPKTSNERELLDYNIPGFTLHSINLEPESNKGHGLAVYTHNSIAKSVIQIQTDLDYQEACLLEARLHGGDLLLFGCFYRSPTPTATSEANNEKLNKLLHTISLNKKYTHKCCIGDFNYKDINWTSWTTTHNQSSREAKFIETIRDSYLHQHLHETTRRRGNDEPSLIDLVFSDKAMQISDIEYAAPLGKSDHSVISFKYQCYIQL